MLSQQTKYNKYGRLKVTAILLLFPLRNCLDAFPLVTRVNTVSYIWE